jgi:hypothetical protein
MSRPNDNHKIIEHYDGFVSGNFVYGLLIASPKGPVPLR